MKEPTINSIKHDYPKTTIKQAYFLASMPRSGSTLLSKLLMEVGLGVPHEYLTKIHRENLMERVGCKNELDYFNWLKKTRVTSNGIFGINSHAHIAQPFQASLDANFDFTHYILLKRRNIIAQAVSWALARQRGSWCSSDRDNFKPKFNQDLISQCLSKIVAGYTYWDLFTKEKGLKTLEIFYEDFTFDINATLKNIINFLEVRSVIKITPAQTLDNFRKQGNHINHEFIEKYKESLRQGKVRLDFISLDL